MQQKEMIRIFIHTENKLRNFNQLPIKVGTYGQVIK